MTDADRMLALYLRLPGTPRRLSRADRVLALALERSGVPFELGAYRLDPLPAC